MKGVLKVFVNVSRLIIWGKFVFAHSLVVVENPTLKNTVYSANYFMWTMKGNIINLAHIRGVC